MPENSAIVKAGEGSLILPTREYDLEVQNRYLPVMSLAVARERRQMIIEAIRELMVEATEANNFEGDYGVIPGTKQKTLLQPGADKLNNLFGLVPRFETIRQELDWTGEDHGGEPFFFYELRAGIWRGPHLMGEGIGSANSWESKYRYRKAERVCPACGTASIIKGKAEYGGGWVCFSRKGGCGAKFDDNEPSIREQIVGNVPNEHIFDIVNTVLKIAAKRCKIAGTINATSAHEFFTQDLDDAKVLPGQDETFEQMRERKIREAIESQAGSARPPMPENGHSTPPKAEDKPSPSVEKMWKQMTSVATIADVFNDLRDQCLLKLGEKDGAAFFKLVLKEFGAEKPDQIRKFSVARQCARALHERLAQVKPAQPAAAADPPPPSSDAPVVEGAFRPVDDDIPDTETPAS